MTCLVNGWAGAKSLPKLFCKYCVIVFADEDEGKGKHVTPGVLATKT